MSESTDLDNSLRDGESDSAEMIGLKSMLLL